MKQKLKKFTIKLVAKDYLSKPFKVGDYTSDEGGYAVSKPEVRINVINKTK